MADDERLVRGGPVLNDVLKSYDQYRPAIAAAGKKVTIVRFEARPNSPDEWWARMEASRISAEQKVKNFSRLGFTVDPVVDHVVLPDSVSRAEFLEVVRRANEDPAVSGIIVQFPPPEQVKDYIGEIAPEKDVDALLDQDSPYPACATAEGIWRVVERFAQDHPQIAVVGSKGFVGRGVVRMLEANGHQPIQLDINDDHNRVKEADIVISVTGKPGILGPEHLKPEHRLVVDSGFVPQRDGSPCGDVQPEATSIPQHITPVPGGTGPIEMAILMERAVRKEAAPNLPSWQYAGPSSRSQESATGLAVRAYGEPAREAIRGPAPGRTAGPVKPTTQEPAPRPRPAQKPNEDVR